jgi:hypothetical protein
MRFVARSKSDPNGDNGGLEYDTELAARDHAATMNKLVESYPDGLWNTDFWKTTPKEWIVYKK